MSIWSYFFIFFFMSLSDSVFAHECRGRVNYFENPFSNKCMRCEQPSLRNPEQTNCTFPNTDHCCEMNSCNDFNLNFSKWINGECTIPK